MLFARIAPDTGCFVLQWLEFVFIVINGFKNNFFG